MDMHQQADEIEEAVAAAIAAARAEQDGLEVER